MFGVSWLAPVEEGVVVAKFGRRLFAASTMRLFAAPPTKLGI